MIKLSEGGKSSRKIASTLSVGKSTVNDVIKRYWKIACEVEGRGKPRKEVDIMKKGKLVIYTYGIILYIYTYIESAS